MKKIIMVLVMISLLLPVIGICQDKTQPTVEQIQQRLAMNQMEMRAINAEYMIMQQNLQEKQNRYNELKALVDKDQALLIQLTSKDKKSK